MNKQELVSAIIEKTQATKVATEQHLAATLEAISDALANGDSITLIGFGTFKVTERKARKGRNPKTGEEIKIAASKSPTFKTGKTLKEKVNAPKKKPVAKKK